MAITQAVHHPPQVPYLGLDIGVLIVHAKQMKHLGSNQHPDHKCVELKARFVRPRTGRSA